MPVTLNAALSPSAASEGRARAAAPSLQGLRARIRANLGRCVLALALAAGFAAVSLGASAKPAQALMGQQDPAGFVRELARDSARIAHTPDLTDTQRKDALRRLVRRNVDHNRLSRFLVRTTGASGEGESQNALLDEAQETAIGRFSDLLNDQAIGRLYPSKVALLPDGLAIVETHIDYQGQPSRVWSWQLTRMQTPEGGAGWGLLDIVAEERQSVALATRSFVKTRLRELAASEAAERSAPVRQSAGSTTVSGPEGAATSGGATPASATGGGAALVRQEAGVALAARESEAMVGVGLPTPASAESTAVLAAQ